LQPTASRCALAAAEPHVMPPVVENDYLLGEENVEFPQSDHCIYLYAYLPLRLCDYINVHSIIGAYVADAYDDGGCANHLTANTNPVAYSVANLNPDRRKNGYAYTW
jgi:hypothetical protein